MERKTREYFDAGTRLVWIVDPRKRIVRSHTAPRHSTLHTTADTLDAAPVLPGLLIPVVGIFPAPVR